VLGIHPQAYWIEKETEYLGNISLSTSFSWKSGPPEWTYRGFFINDEDQLGGTPVVMWINLSGWAQDPMGEKVFTLQMWDVVYQTILR
jgi:hypothetical protein